MAGEPPRWRFRRMLPSEINQDPVQGEFFTNVSDLPERLVRESLQNSLDARIPGETVRVRFAFSGEDGALPAGDAARYLDGLAPHVSAGADADAAEREAIEEARACLARPMTWLAIEDFGTSGLAGDIEANDPKQPGNHFWGFFRSIGISPKGEDAGGSWGLGKWVFPDASKINAYLGATRRAGEDRTLLMGMAVLRTHTAAGVKHPPYGQFAAHDDGGDDEWLPLPVDSETDPDVVRKALDDFRLERLGRSGLSVVMPYPKPDLTAAAIKREVITQYFLPIVRGVLSVEIAAPGEHRVIDRDTIAREVGDIARPDDEDTRAEETPDSLDGVIRLAQWAIGRGDGDHEALPVPTRSHDTLELLDLEGLRERYENNERLAFRLDIGVQRRDAAERAPCDFRLYLERAEGLPQGHDYFVRGHRSISHMDHVQRFKARVLVTVDGETPLGHMLRDSEGPAHVSWDASEQRLRDYWVAGPERVREVRRAAERLLQRLVERPDELQLDALADLFPADPAPIRGRRPSVRPGAGPSSGGAPPPLPPSALEVSRTGVGFSVHAPRGADAGSEWDLRFAYDTVRGNPYRLFEQGAEKGVPDFSIGDGVEVHPRSAEVERVADNALRFRVTGDDFRLDVTGLDDRDVIVDVDRVGEPADAAEAEATA